MCHAVVSRRRLERVTQLFLFRKRALFFSSRPVYLSVRRPSAHRRPLSPSPGHHSTTPPSTTLPLQRQTRNASFRSTALYQQIDFVALYHEEAEPSFKRGPPTPTQLLLVHHSTTHRLHNCCLFDSKKRYTFAIIISHQYRINGEITVASPISSSPCHHHSSSHPPPITHIYHLSHDSGGVTIAISVHIITISLRRKRSYSTNCLIGEILAYFIGREKL